MWDAMLQLICINGLSTQSHKCAIPQVSHTKMKRREKRPVSNKATKRDTRQTRPKGRLICLHYALYLSTELSSLLRSTFIDFLLHSTRYVTYLHVYYYLLPRLFLLLHIKNMQGMSLSSSLPPTNSSVAVNGAGLRMPSRVFVFTPLPSSTRLAMFLPLVAGGIMGFVGNILVLCFLQSKKKTNSIMKTCSFVKNFNVYIKSLAISDALTDVISLPPICCML